MASRYTKLSHSTLNDLPLIQLPYEQLDSILGQAQQTKDMFEQVKEMMPNYLQEHSDSAKKYADYVGKVSDEVTNAFASGDVKKAMATMRVGQKAILGEWKKGGIANALETEYQRRQKQIEEYDKLHEDARKKGIDINYRVGLNRMKTGPLNYDPTKRTWDQVSGPNAPAYFDYNKEFLDWAKAAKAGENDTLHIGKDWVYVNGEKKYKLAELAEEFMNTDPRAQTQIGIESEYKLMGMSDEQKQSYVNSIKENALKQNEGIDAEFSEFEKLLNSKNKEERKSAQAILKSQGYYDGDIDGDIQTLSKEALQKLKKDLDSKKDENSKYAEGLTVDSLPGILSSQARNSFIRKADALAPDSKIIKNLQANWRTEMAVSFHNSRRLQNEYLETLFKRDQRNLFVDKELARPYENITERMNEVININNNLKSQIGEAVKEDNVLRPLLDPTGQLSNKQLSEKAIEMGTKYALAIGKGREEAMAALGFAPDDVAGFQAFESAISGNSDVKEAISQLSSNEALANLYKGQKEHLEKEFENNNPEAKKLGDEIRELRKQGSKSESVTNFSGKTDTWITRDSKLKALEKRYDNMMKEEIENNLQQYNTFIPTGISISNFPKETQDVLQQHIKDNIGRFGQKSDGTPNYWKVAGGDGKGYKENKSFTPTPESIRLSSYFTTTAGEIVVKLAGSDADGNTAIKEAVLDGDLSEFFKDVSESLLLGAAGNEGAIEDPRGFQELVKVTDPNFYTGLNITPDSGTQGTVIADDRTLLSTKINVIDETDGVLFITYNDNNDKQHYGVVAQNYQGGDPTKPIPNSYTTLPTMDSDNPSNPRYAHFTKTDYEAARANFLAHKNLGVNSPIYETKYVPDSKKRPRTKEEIIENAKRFGGMRNSMGGLTNSSFTIRGEFEQVQAYLNGTQEEFSN